jgi:hypothetical protein
VPGTTRVLLLEIEGKQVAEKEQPRPQVIVALVERTDDTADPLTSVDVAEEAP